MNRYTYILFLLMLCIAACENEIPYDGDYQDPKMVIHTVATAGEDSLTCYIGRSYFFLDTKPSIPEVLDSLTISLTGTSGDYTIIRDSVAGTAHHLRLSRPVEAGDTLHLQVTHPRFGIVKAQEITPPDFTPQIVATTWEKSTVSQDNKYRIRIRLPGYPLNDKIVQMRCITYFTTTSIRPIFDQDRNFVRWVTIVTSRANPVMFSADELFAGYNNYTQEMHGYYYTTLNFPSDYPSGKEFELTITLNYPYDYWSGEEPYTYYQTYTLDSCNMTFTLTSDAYDLYYASMLTYLGMNESSQEEFDIGVMLASMFGQEEQTPVYSNVVNGYGIFATQTKTKIKIK